MSCGQLRPQGIEWEIVKRRKGKISLLLLVLVLLAAVLAGLLGNAGYTTQEKLQVRHASDAVAFSSALWMARGMNGVTACNHIIGEATAMLVLHDALGGAELRLGLQINPAENRQVDRAIQALARIAPIGQIPNKYIPVVLTNVDRRIIEAVTRRAAPTPTQDLEAFGMLYDARLTLKRRLVGCLAAKSLANLSAFAFPPPLDIIATAAAYVVHIGATAQIVEIGKEWWLLEVVELYASNAVKLQHLVFEQQLIPSLHEFANEVAGYESPSDSAADGTADQTPGLVGNAIDRMLPEWSTEHRALSAIVPSTEELRLPVVPESKPPTENFSSSFPEPWGTDSTVPPPNIESPLGDATRQLKETLRRMNGSRDALVESQQRVGELIEEIEQQIADGELPSEVHTEAEAELARLEQLSNELTEQIVSLDQAQGAISEQVDAIEQASMLVGPGTSQNPSLEHIPRTLNPDRERYSQWVRATAPAVDALRAPVLGIMESQLKLSRASEHYIKWTNRYNLIRSWQFRSGERLERVSASQAEWRPSETPMAMLVMKGANQEGSRRKGYEAWTLSSEAARVEVEELFSVLGLAHREFTPLMSPQVFRAGHAHGTTTFSHAIFYNGNQQAPDSGGADEQSPIGWDTLNWDTEQRLMPEWGSPASTADARWPWELFDSPDDEGQVKLNWQAKLIPTTENKLHSASTTELPAEFKRVVELAVGYSSLIDH